MSTSDSPSLLSLYYPQSKNPCSSRHIATNLYPTIPESPTHIKVAPGHKSFPFHSYLNEPSIRHHDPTHISCSVKKTIFYYDVCTRRRPVFAPHIHSRWYKHINPIDIHMAFIISPRTEVISCLAWMVGCQSAPLTLIYTVSKHPDRREPARPPPIYNSKLSYPVASRDLSGTYQLSAGVLTRPGSWVPAILLAYSVYTTHSQKIRVSINFHTNFSMFFSTIFFVFFVAEFSLCGITLSLWQVNIFFY